MAEQRRTPRTPTAMVVGKSGMGKSTLCNYLLYGTPRPTDGFEAKGGKHPVTTSCEAKEVASTAAPHRFNLRPGGPLKLIDTPGIPDPNGRTLDFYNKIVNTARETGGLNALIVAVCFNNDRDQTRKDFETYRILLTQFEKMPVMKVLVCRARLQPDLTEKQQEEDLAPVREWAAEILKSGGMESAHTFMLIDNETQVEQLFKLRKLLTKMPWTPIEDRNLRSYSDLKESAQRLISQDTRMEELRRKKARRELEKQQLKRRMVQLKDMNGLIIAAWASLFMIPWAVAKDNEKWANELRHYRRGGGGNRPGAGWR